MPKAFILLSHERSGSHLVGEFMSTLTDFRMFDEVCNPDALKPAKNRESLYRFRYDALQENPNLLLEPSVQGHREFVKSYFEYLGSISRATDFAVDIKYGHVHNFEWCWWPMLERPSLFSVCEANDIGIIHLFRENVVEATVSSLIASQRKIWHSWQAEAEGAIHQPVNLPIKSVLNKARLLERQTREFTQWTAKNRKLEITYKRAAAELGKGGALDDAIFEFTGVKLRRPFVPRVQKLTPPLREAVENFEELRLACIDAGWARFVA